MFCHVTTQFWLHVRNNSVRSFRVETLAPDPKPDVASGMHNRNKWRVRVIESTGTET